MLFKKNDTSTTNYYGNPVRKNTRRLLLLTVFAGIIGTVIVLGLSTSRNAQHKELQKSLHTYEDATFKIDYPQNYMQFLPDDLTVKFVSSDQDSPESITVSYESAESSSITPDRIDFFAKRASETGQKITTNKFKIGNYDAATITSTDPSNAELKIDTTYVFTQQNTWTILVAYLNNSELAQTRSLIVKSFEPKAIPEVTDEQQDVFLDEPETPTSQSEGQGSP